MTTQDMPLCSDPIVADRYKIWECGQLHFHGRDPWPLRGRDDPDPFEATPESCADAKWGTPEEAAWLRATFENAPWGD
jgi:hypothetical protein